MNRDEVLEYCLSLREAVEDYPFGDDVAVFKVGGKVFALVALDGESGRVTLKCDPEWAVELRATYPAVRPGYHTNKRHWKESPFQFGHVYLYPGARRTLRLSRTAALCAGWKNDAII